MSEFFDALEPRHVAMIEQQPVFFVATAAADGRINLSPKGYDAFRVLERGRVAYLDLGGSGNETHAHLVAPQQDAGRITIMFCNFQQPALILRIYGKGRPVLPQDDEWDALAANFTMMPGTRQIFVIDIDSVQTSCGWGVPFMAYESERETLKKAHRQSDPAEWEAKVAQRTTSIDGLPTRASARYIASD